MTSAKRTKETEAVIVVALGCGRTCMTMRRRPVPQLPLLPQIGRQSQRHVIPAVRSLLTHNT